MKKWIPLMLAISIIFILAGCGNSTGQEENSYQQVSMEEAVEIMEEETGYIILDVRTEEEFSERHIPNAINIPNESIGSEELQELPNKEQLVLVYCRSGNRSKQAAEKLTQMGYTNIVEFGGINDWTGETVSEDE
ncbi:MAG: rhodanese-like domain-containing protein [Lachnospiraceae bacterium]